MIWCERCGEASPHDEWARVTRNDGAGIVGRRKMHLAVTVYRHRLCNWFAVVVPRSATLAT